MKKFVFQARAASERRSSNVVPEMVLFSKIYKFFIFFWKTSMRPYKIGVVGNNWLVSNAIFSETALRTFLIFCMKLQDYKRRKVTAGFLKKILDLKIFAKRSPY